MKTIHRTVLVRIETLGIKIAIGKTIILTIITIAVREY